jgi:hypothetical protein
VDKPGFILPPPTNGVSLTGPDGAVTEIDPGDRRILPSGSRLMPGEFGVSVVLG